MGPLWIAELCKGGSGENFGADHGYCPIERCDCSDGSRDHSGLLVTGSRNQWALESAIENLSRRARSRCGTKVRDTSTGIG